MRSEMHSFCTVNSIMFLPKGNLNKPTGALINLMNQLFNFTDDKKENELKLPNCKHREIDYFKGFSKTSNSRPCLFFM